MNNANKFLEIFNYIKGFFSSNLTWQDFVLYFLQFLIIGYFLFRLYKYIKGSYSATILNGMLVLLPFAIISYILKLTILIKVFELLLPTFFVGIIILFAPELRRFLHQIGKDGFSWVNLLYSISDKDFKADEDNQSIDKISEEIIKSIKILSGNKIGALIVFDSTWSDKLYISSGRKLDAVVSTELLLNIFYPKSPLHDGAVLILNRRIYSAAVILPITENSKLNPWQYGTRHRAGLGISEISNTSLSIIVSEETGSVSIADNAKITKISSTVDLKNLIKKALSEQY